MESWPLQLFNKSVLKQEKLNALLDGIGGATTGLSCLDVGGDNGVVSLLLRELGGDWVSADLDEGAVAAIRELVGGEVVCLGGATTPFADDHFDLIVIIDYFEHIDDDTAFVAELQRILRPGGRLVVNTPHAKTSLLRRLRLVLGQSDAKHGHVRHGYTDSSMLRLLDPYFSVTSVRTYSRFFSELIDTAMQAAVEQTKGESNSQKGVFVTGGDMAKHRKALRLYSAIYPVLKAVSTLNLFVPFSGYKLIATATSKKTRDGA
jgi:SAM-dependent methyltransferase